MDHHDKFPPSRFHWVSLKSYFDCADIGHYVISFWCLILYIIDTELLKAYCLLTCTTICTKNKSLFILMFVPRLFFCPRKSKPSVHFLSSWTFPFSALDGALRPSSPPISCLCVIVATPEGTASQGLIPNLQSEGLERVPKVASSSLSAYTSVQDRPRYLICSPWPMPWPHLAGNNPRLLHSAL